MKYDVIVIGAGLGGLGCAARLAKAGRSVLVLEAEPHIGGTSAAFRRNGYGFPMGPLSFSHPRRVRTFLQEIGAADDLSFTRSHFQVLDPTLDLIISRSFAKLEADLKHIFPEEPAIGGTLSDLRELIRRTSSALRRERMRPHPGEPGSLRQSGSAAWLENTAAIPCGDWLKARLSSRRLINLLGSMGANPPRMSQLNLAVMWGLMSRVGIWTPNGGVQTLSTRLKEAFRSAGGELRTSDPVESILTDTRGAAGVRTASGEPFSARWVVSNADYKTTFLELVSADALPAGFRKAVGDVPYSGSELCVYLGLDPARVDWRRMRATHLLYQQRIPESGSGSDPSDFAARQVEICRWSDHAPGLTPPGKASLLLRAGLPYADWAAFRTGFRRRTSAYAERKARAAQDLIRTAGHALPGLEEAVEVMEAATPLTYADWGRRWRGSIAGWTWGTKSRPELRGPMLVRTPVSRLLCAGIYAAADLYLGGVPTSLHTAGLAADVILNDPMD